VGGRDYNHRDVERTAVCVESQQVKDKKNIYVELEPQEEENLKPYLNYTI